MSYTITIPMSYCFNLFKHEWFQIVKCNIFDLPVGPFMLDENGAQAARGRVNFILLPVPPTTIAGSGGEVFMSRQRLDTEKSVHLVTDVELAIFENCTCVLFMLYLSL